jgi:hypothetical protein
MILPSVSLLTTYCQQHGSRGTIGKKCDRLFMLKSHFSAYSKPVRDGLLGGEMKFEGNRSIVFDVADRLPEDALRH